MPCRVPPSALQAAQRKRKKQEAAGAAAAGAGALGAGPSAAAASLPAGLAAAADVAADAAAGGKGRGGSKAAQEYIPQLGSAPYAFLLVMLQVRCCHTVLCLPPCTCCCPGLQALVGGGLRPALCQQSGLLQRICELRAQFSLAVPPYLQAQKGPAKQQHFGKQELIDLAEASGLSTKPINGDGAGLRGT